MARLPGYIQHTGKPYVLDGHYYVDIRVRTWHPSLVPDLWALVDGPLPLRALRLVVAWLRLNVIALRKARR